MSDGRFLFLYFPLFGIVLLATYDAEPEKGRGEEKRGTLKIACLPVPRWHYKVGQLFI